MSSLTSQGELKGIKKYVRQEWATDVSQKQGVGRGWQFKWSRVDVKPGKPVPRFRDSA